MKARHPSKTNITVTAIIALAAVLITASWLSAVQTTKAQGVDDVNDNGKPYVWMKDWKLPGTVPHDVTEGGDMTFTIARDDDGEGNSQPVTLGLLWQKRPNSPEIRDMVTYSSTNNPRPDWVQIPAGATEATFSWSTTDDDQWERDIWLFVCMLSAPTGYQFHEDRRGADRNCTGWRIRDDEPAPTITQELKDGQAASVTEGGDVDLKLTRSLPDGKTSPYMSDELTIRVKIKESTLNADGTYTEQVVDPEDPDHKGYPVTFNASENTAYYTYESVDNDHDSPDHTLALIVMPDTTASSTKRERWQLADPNEAWFTILDDEKPSVTVSADKASFSETEGNATFTVTRHGDDSEALTVQLSVTQSGDYMTEPYPLVQAVIPIGANTATASLPLHNDDIHEPDGSISVEIIDQPPYNVGAENTARTTVTSEDVQQHVYVEGRTWGAETGASNALLKEIEEGEAATFRVRRRERDGDRLSSANIANRDEIQVNLKVSQQGKFRDGDRVLAWDPENASLDTATELSTDADGLFTVTIPAGEDDVWVGVPTLDDRRLFSRDGQAYYALGNRVQRTWQPAYELHGSVTLEAVAGENYTPGRPNGSDASDSVKVLDNEPPIVTLSRDENTPELTFGTSPSQPKEGDPWTFWVNRYRDETDQPLDVRIQISVQPKDCIDIHANASTHGRTLLKGESPVLDEHLGERTVTIPAGASYTQVSVLTQEDVVTECSPKLRAQVLQPPNAETLREAHPLNQYSRADFLLWDYHSFHSPAELLTQPQWQTGRATALGTILEKSILDDDPYPFIVFSKVEAPEDGGNAVMTVHLSHNNHLWDYTLDWRTTDGTATAGEDYTTASGTVTLPADIGNTETISRDLTVPIIDDRLHEPGENEKIQVNFRLSSPGQRRPQRHRQADRRRRPDTQDPDRGRRAQAGLQGSAASPAPRGTST